MAFIQMPGRPHPAPGLQVHDLLSLLEQLLRKQWERGYDAGRNGSPPIERCRVCRNPVAKRVCTPFGTYNLCEGHAQETNPTQCDTSPTWMANPPFSDETKAWMRAANRYSDAGFLEDPIGEIP